jgi:hypothetical protein
MKYYYWLWIDFIRAAQKNDNSEIEARIYALVFLSMAFCFNIFILIGTFESLFGVQFHWDIQEFSSKKLNSLASFIFNFYLLPFLLNYVLVIRKYRWKKIRVKYGDTDSGKIHLGKGRYSLMYFVLSAISFVLFVVVAGLMRHS